MLLTNRIVVRSITVIPWFRDFLAEFLLKETDEVLLEMGKSIERLFPEDQWRTGQSFYIIDISDRQIEVMTETNAFQRFYDALRDRKAANKDVVGKMWEFNYITVRMQEWIRLVKRLTGGKVVISTKRRRKVMQGPPPYPEESVRMEDVRDDVQCPKTCVPEVFSRYAHIVTRALEELQACLVVAGGRKIPIRELAATPLGDLLFTGLPNGVSLKAYLTNEFKVG